MKFVKKWQNNPCYLPAIKIKNVHQQIFYFLIKNGLINQKILTFYKLYEASTKIYLFSKQNTEFSTKKVEFSSKKELLEFVTLKYNFSNPKYEFSNKIIEFLPKKTSFPQNLKTLN